MRRSNRALGAMVLAAFAVLAATQWLTAQVRSGAWQVADRAAALNDIVTAAGSAIAVATSILMFVYLTRRKREG